MTNTNTANPLEFEVNETVVTATSASTDEQFAAKKGAGTEYGLHAQKQPEPVSGPLPSGCPTGTATTNNTDNK